ncbi:MAG: Hsp20/alpha crystallin family protein [candidate division WOR-3 bacterium]|nr:Hsp20/alpha crystallin family protein [candidate division WOR-3 bacterium]
MITKDMDSVLFDHAYHLIESLKGEWLPYIDLYENETSFFLIIELAGVDKEDLKITIEDEQVIKIRGERKNTLKSEKNTSHYKVEIRFGKFARDLLLPQKIDIKNILIEQSNGIFKLTLNKKLPKKIKVIEIENS